jgi:hypothetical protein
LKRQDQVGRFGTTPNNGDYGEDVQLPESEKSGMEINERVYE